ncbi:nuclear GTP-binding protein [Paragonimus westermani]|uniref:Nucleolar GTP-binding protein 2 n=1 Tax=Paragonimus westermani TaxID=34504 RepID=A0A5J4NSD3_9TREM|nr:nuclear GTP-binding protein [Paragonimus westermani]
MLISKKKGISKEESENEDDIVGPGSTAIFNHGMCDACCSSAGCSTCLFVLLCNPCAYQEILSDVGVPRACTYQIGTYCTCFTPCCWGFLIGCLRRKVRMRRSIAGSQVDDWCLSCCCPFCILTQLIRQIRDDLEERHFQQQNTENTDDIEDSESDGSETVCHLFWFKPLPSHKRANLRYPATVMVSHRKSGGVSHAKHSMNPGNTRVISQSALQNFKEAMKVQNPYEVVLKQTKLPVSLLDEKRIVNFWLSVDDAFRKQSHLYLLQKAIPMYLALVHNAETTQQQYDAAQDRHRLRQDDGVRDLVKQPHFKAGQSKRLWNELFKVLDSSDVVLYVLDARDPMGTRSAYIEKYLKTEKPHKHFIFVINKVDLVPVWITKRWKAILSEEYPTMIFHADMNKPIGKIALMGLLRQLSSLHSKHRPQISVGIIGYPNVGKSSIINALRSKRLYNFFLQGLSYSTLFYYHSNRKVCKVAPLAGETKVWQYVNLMKSIFLIDCPGVVYPDGATEAELVMKGVVRVEYLHQPDLYIKDVLDRVQTDYIQARYRLPALRDSDPSAPDMSEPAWNTNPEVFLELVARHTGKLLKGGEPDLMTTAKRVLNDFQRGKLPYFVKPPSEPETNKDDREAQFSEEFVKDLAMDNEEPGELNDDRVSSTRPLSSPTVTTIESELLHDLVDMDEGSDSEARAHGVCELDETENSSVMEQTFPVEALNGKLKRNLDRALRRQRGRAGRQFYSEIREKRGIHSKSVSSELEIKPTRSLGGKRLSEKKRQKR